MALGRRKDRREQELFVATDQLAQAPGHVFYRKLNQLLAEHGFDEFVEELCRESYSDGTGRPSIPPGVYFRMHFVGYFEGIESQRGVCWRCADSRSLAEFLGYGPTESTPDHSSLTRVRQRLSPEIHERVFCWVLSLAEEKKLLKGKTVAVDATTLEANAAMKSIVRKETGEDYKEYLRGLAREAGMEDPTEEELRRFDRKRADKRISNEEWESPTDPDARVARMKDGRTRLAYKAEHVIDLETEVILGATIRPADQGDAESLVDGVLEAEANLQSAEPSREIKEVVADKGYHKTSTLELCRDLGMRTYIPEPSAPHRRDWTDKPPSHRQAVYENRRRMGRAKGKALQKLRSERVERSFAHVCDSGGARRTWLRGLVDVTKRYLTVVAGHNLGLILRKLFGAGKPRRLQGAGGLAALAPIVGDRLRRLLRALASPPGPFAPRPIDAPRSSFAEGVAA
jgi:transposase